MGVGRRIEGNNFLLEKATGGDMPKMKKVLVTGGAGFIGANMVRFLKEKGYWVRAVDVKDHEYTKQLRRYANEFLWLDLRLKENCLKATSGMDEVYNYAANMGGIGFITTVKADIMHDSALININMLKAAVENSVGRYFFSSSACIYPKELQGTVEGLPLKEEHAFPANPDSFYGWEKLFTEILCKAFHEDYGLETRIARFHNTYGIGNAWKGGREKAPAALCRKVAEANDGGTITIWGDGKQTRSFIYIDDNVKATYKLMKSDYREPLNIGTDKLITIDALADLIINISGKKLDKKYDLSQPQGVRGRNADLTLVKKVLDWMPKVSYEEGLTKMYRWIEEQIQAEASGYA
jgi:nucleoside-diphosphate-sugar epimerase